MAQKKKKLSAAEKLKKQKLDKKARNARYRAKRKAYDNYVKEVTELKKRGAVRIAAIPSYKDFWKLGDLYVSGERKKQQGKKKSGRKSRFVGAAIYEETAKHMLNSQLLITKNSAKSGRENIVRRVDTAIAEFGPLIAKMSSRDDVIDHLNAFAGEHTTLPWEDRVRAVALMAFVIGGYVQVKQNANGFYLKRTGQPTLQDFRFIAGKWHPAREFIRMQLGKEEEEAYGS